VSSFCSSAAASLERVFAALVVADADGFVDAADEDFAVADAAGAGERPKILP
jgi:hypothetical protein